MSALQQALMARAAGAADADFANVVLLMKGAAFTDSSSFARTVTLGSTAPTIDTGVTKWGGGSMKFVGNANCYAEVSANFGFNAAITDAFTIEFWVLFPAAASTAAFAYCLLMDTGSTDYVFFRGSGAQAGRMNCNRYSAGGQGGYGAGLVADTWHHICLRRSNVNGQARITLGGVHDASFNTLNQNNQLDGTVRVRVGASDGTVAGAPSGVAQCYIEDLRITRFVNRYTSSAAATDFTPPTATFPTS